jgi:AraC-like DNA-binding protein
LNNNYIVKNIDDFYLYFVEECNFLHEDFGSYSKYVVDKEIGDGFLEKIVFYSGIEICITDLFLKKSLGFKYQMKKMPLEINYVESGNIFNDVIGMGELNSSSDRMSIYFRDKMEGTMKLIKGRHIRYITIMANNNFVNNNMYEGYDIVFADKALGKYNYLTEPSRPDSELKYIFKQMLECDFSDTVKSLYLQSKSIEALSHVIEKKLISESILEKDIYIDKVTINSLDKARAIIEMNLSNPLSIPQLSEKVDLNQYKLKKCFKQYYGMTIFQYIKQERMRRAMELLKEGELNVSQVAYEIGYINISHFSRNFKKVYGKNPKDFQFGL